MHQIDVIPAEDMTREWFEAEYAYSGRPLLVKNVTGHWPAMEKFRLEIVFNFRPLGPVAKIAAHALQL